MKLPAQQNQWEHLSRTDPLWAILTHPDKRDGGWNYDEFLATGRTLITSLLRSIEPLGLPRARTAALDFGCGAGRLTYALADAFDAVTGVDISEGMLALARAHNPAPERCRFLLNTEDHLRQFADASFDLVHTHIVLQHIPPRHARAYLREFVRVLRPGGLLIFQVPSHLSSRSALSRAGYHWNLFVQRKLRRDPAVLEMYGIPRATVESDLSLAGARLLEVRPDDSARPEWDSFQYFATR